MANRSGPALPNLGVVGQALEATMLIRWKCADFYLGPEATLSTLPLREAEYMTATGTLLISSTDTLRSGAVHI
jgi:hypothetical protein